MAEDPSVTPESPSEPSFSSAFAVFEGGGAKGIAHAGVYRALEKAGFALLGVAGTSAGAIFASLVAVGYRPGEIFRSGDDHILTRLGSASPIDLIGKESWRQVRSAKTGLALMLLGIAVSTVLSTLLATLVLGEQLGPDKDRGVALLAGIAGGLFGARLLPLGSKTGRGWLVGAIAALCLILTVAICLVNDVTNERIIAAAGLVLALAFVAVFRTARDAYLLGALVVAIDAVVLNLQRPFAPWTIAAALMISMLYSVLFALLQVRPFLARRGLSNGVALREIINEALRRKLNESWDASIDGPLPAEILFRHIAPNERNGCIPLKVITTDIDAGRLVLVDHNHPDVPVAQAVAASAALPLIFEPARIRGLGTDLHSFADGGLVSNLPSWVFRDEKRQRERMEAASAGQFRRIPVFTVSLAEPGAPIEDKWWDRFASLKRLSQSLSYFSRLIETGIFGGQSTVQNLVADLKPIEIRTQLTTLDIDCGSARAEAQVKDAEDQTLAILRREFVRDNLAQTILERIRVSTQDHARQKLGKPDLNLRAVLLDPIFRERGQTAPAVLRVRHMVGGIDETDTDDELELDFQGNLSAAAYCQNRIVHGRIKGKGAGALHMTKYEYALLPSRINSAIAFPVLTQNGAPERVVCLDASVNLAPLMKDDYFKNMVVSLCVPLAKDHFDKAVAELLDGTERKNDET